MERLVLIDGHAILHRAYHAFPTSLTTTSGQLINAAYGFTRMLLRVIEELQPKYLAVAFDLPGETFRNKEFLGYQAQRPEMDQELAGQIEPVYKILNALNVPIFTCEGYEADDVIGTLARQAFLKIKNQKSKIKNTTQNSKLTDKILEENTEVGLETIIVTGDKDIMQLVNEKVKVYFPRKGFTEAEVFDEKKVEELLGIPPSKIIDYKALVGDSSDNYPGVPGVGPKTAVNLLKEYGSVDNIFEKLDRIESETIREKLKNGKESAFISKKLATIVTDAPVTLDLEKCEVQDYDKERAVALFKELEFRSLINKLPGAAELEIKEEKKSEQTTLF